MPTLLLLVALSQIEVVDHTQPTTVPVVSLQVVNHIPVTTVAKTSRGYPVRTAGKLWYHGGYWPQAKHLNEGEHTNLFDTKWLGSLSPQDLLNLHSDAHEGRVNWEYAFRPGEFVAPKEMAVPARRLVQYCVNGRCYLFWE